LNKISPIFRYRKKGDKIQVQKFEQDKWVSRTLPSAEETFRWLCPGSVSSTQAQIKQEEQPKVPQKCVHDLLSEPLKQDTNKEMGIVPELSKEEIEKLSILALPEIEEELDE
jgi:hypothetical protein